MASIFDDLTRSDDDKHNPTNGDYKLNATATSTPRQPASQTPNTENTHRTPLRLREAAQELLRFGFLEEAQKPNLYRTAITYLPDLNRILEPLDLSANADEIRGLVYTKVCLAGDSSDEDQWSHPLIRRQRLNLEQSLMVAILRQYFVTCEQEAGTGASQALVAIDDLVPQLQVFLGDPGSEAKERNRVLNLLDQLKGHGLVSAPDAHDRVTIKPIIAHLANPENLQALLQGLRQQVLEQDGAKPEGSGREPE